MVEAEAAVAIVHGANAVDIVEDHHHVRCATIRIQNRKLNLQVGNGQATVAFPIRFRVTSAHTKQFRVLFIHRSREWS